MPYEPSDFETIRTQLLAVLRNHRAGADVSAASENYVRASLAAGATALLMYGVSYVERQIFPDSADTANLERHAALYDLERKEPTAATGGSVELTGTNGTVVTAGLVGVHADGTVYTTTAGGTIASGVLVVTASATTTGSAGNKVADDELTIQSPPIGVDATATISADFAGGTDLESDAALLARVLARMRAGNAGGTDADYEQWALTIPGVVAADCLATRRGAGTVSVAVYTEGVGGRRTPADSTKRAEVLAYIQTVRPTTAEVDVPAVTEVDVDFDVAVLEYEEGYDPAEVRAAVVVALEDGVYALTTGATLYWTAVNRIVASVPGVRDFSLLVPSDNTACGVDSSTVEILVPGTVAVT